MKFKVGDRVRLTREGIIRHLSFLDTKTKSWLEKIIQLSDWFTIEHHSPELCYCDKEEYRVKEEHLELVPEEPEFEYSEEVEVKDDCDSKWYKAIFIWYIPWADKNPKYMTVSSEDFEKCKKHEYFTVGVWEYARKLRPQLTRKEIAEKFSVSEDFTLVD